MTNTTISESVMPVLGQALDRRGYSELTPVQQAVLADTLRASDLLVSAQTGSGKTVAFGLAVAPTLLGDADQFAVAPVPLALVVAPTRELALQVKRELQWLYADTAAAVVSCVGGMDMHEERRNLQRSAHIVVGTPGRLRDHIERGSFDPSGLKAVVLDEADEMLDLGFREDLEFILNAAPATRRTLMFSATVPSSIATLARRYQRDAVRISTTAEQAQHVDIEYRALTVAPNDRENAIINVLRYFEAKNALVFCATRAAVNRLTSRLNNRGFSVVALSGELSQNERTHALQAMRDGRARVCVATDVAARGIDLPNLELVIHADMPKTRESLLHRSGRTGRAGRKGVCVLIVAHNERRRAERLLGSANVAAEWARPPTVEAVLQRDRERIIDDPALSDPPNPEEAAFVQALLARHGAEQVAVAFLRLHSAGHSAPEELLDTGPPERKEKTKRRDDFKGGVWFSLSVGFKQNAEARWLLPMLCRFGQLTKNEVGAIKVRPDETHVELAPESVERFLAAIGPDRIVEGSIVATALDKAPQSGNDARVGAGVEKAVGGSAPAAVAAPPRENRQMPPRNKRSAAPAVGKRAPGGKKTGYARKPDAPAHADRSKGAPAPAPHGKRDGAAAGPAQPAYRKKSRQAPSSDARSPGARSSGASSSGASLSGAPSPGASARDANQPDKTAAKPKRKKTTLKMGGRSGSKTAAGTTGKPASKPFSPGKKTKGLAKGGSGFLQRKKSRKNAK